MESHNDDGLNYYTGSRLLSPLASAFGVLTVDKVNFVFCQTAAFLLAYPYRTYLSSNKVSPVVRHVCMLLIGLILTFFCYGYQTLYIIVQTLLCIALMKLIRPGNMEKLVFSVSLLLLCISHLYRQRYDYGGYTMDVSGALMINTMRMSSMAYSLADGHMINQGKPTLNSFHELQSIRKMPTLLEIFSYVFCFTNALCGPFIFYNDYLIFIEGRTPQSNEILNKLMWKKVLAAVIWVSFYISMSAIYPISLLRGNEFFEYSFYGKLFLLHMVTSCCRTQYYFAWKLAEAANHNAGIGFNGYDENNQPKWDLVDNVKITNVEFSSNLKAIIDNWNIRTTIWLRFVVYERVRFHRKVCVYCVSALWHGFYPGYYIMFGTVSFMAYAANFVRKHIRPIFMQRNLNTLYDVITFCVTRIFVAYGTFAFVILEFNYSIRMYSSMYFSLHFVTIASVLIFSYLRLFKSFTGSTKHT